MECVTMSIFYRYNFGNCRLTNWIQVENRKEESGAIEFGDENMTMTLIRGELLHHGRRVGQEEMAEILVVSGKTNLILHIETYQL